MKKQSLLKALCLLIAGIFLMSSCTWLRYGKPFLAHSAAEYHLEISPPEVRNDQIVTTVQKVAMIPQKAELIRRPSDDDSVSGAVAAGVFWSWLICPIAAACFPFSVILSLSESDIDPVNTNLCYLFCPLGSLAWWPVSRDSALGAEKGWPDDPHTIDTIKKGSSFSDVLVYISIGSDSRALSAQWAGLSSQQVTATTLAGWYAAQGKTVPPVSQRAKLYKKFGLRDTYAGTARQNRALLDKLKRWELGSRKLSTSGRYVKAIRTDSNGALRLPLDKQFWSQESLDLTVAHGQLQDNTTVSLLPYYEKRFHLTEENLKEYKRLSGKQRICYLTLADQYPAFFAGLTTEARVDLASRLSPEKAEDPWAVLAIVVSADMNRFLNPIAPRSPAEPPKVTEPELPPVKEIKQSPFENKQMFAERMAAARQKRQKQISGILADYREKVEKRNERVRELNEQYNRAYEKHRAEVKERRARTKEMENRFLKEYFAAIFGRPRLQAAQAKDGSPLYFPEKEMLVADLVYGTSQNPLLRQEISFADVAAGDYAKSLYTEIQEDQKTPEVSFRFSDNHLHIDNVLVKHQRSKLAGRPWRGGLEKEKAQKIVLGYNRPELMAEVKQDFKNQKLSLQSAAVKDVKFETYVARELAEYNDDIPALLRQAPATPKDSKKWLFVLGIEDYQHTNRINFSCRSAEMMAEVARKVLGVPDSNTFLLVDKAQTTGISTLPANRIYTNTAGAIEDQLRFLVRDVGAGDKVYFYYSGHGLPALSQDRQPYILARDKAPDFVAQNEFFNVAEIYRRLSNSRAGEIVVFMDSCFTGETDGRSVFQGSKAATRLVPRTLENFDTEKMAVMCAGTDRQFSNMFTEKGHRLFSYYVMKGILKDNQTVEGLYRQVFVNTKNSSRQLGGTNLQEPTLTGNSHITLR